MHVVRTSLSGAAKLPSSRKRSGPCSPLPVAPLLPEACPGAMQWVGCTRLGAWRLPAQLSPPLHVKHASLPSSILTNRARVQPPPDASTRDLEGVHFQPADGGEFSTGSDKSERAGAFHNVEEESSDAGSSAQSAGSVETPFAFSARGRAATRAALLTFARRGGPALALRGRMHRRRLAETRMEVEGECPAMLRRARITPHP